MNSFLDKRTAIVKLFKAGNSKREICTNSIARSVIHDMRKLFLKWLQLVIYAKGGHIE